MAHGPARPLWIVVGALAVVYGFAALSVARGPGTYSTYAGRGAVEAVAATTVALGLAAAVVAAASRRGGSGRALVATGVAVCWSAPAWVGWSDGPGLVRALGAVAAPYLLPLALQWVLGRDLRWLVVAAYVVTTVDAAGRALFADPVADPHCWADCVGNDFLLVSAPGVAHLVDAVTSVASAALAVALVVAVAVRWRRASLAVRRAEWPATAAGIVIGGAVVTRAALLAARPETSVDRGYDAAYLVLATGVLLLALGPVWSWVRAGTQRRRVGWIAADLAETPRPGHLEAALARAVGDPALAVSYRLPEQDGWVDGRGQTVPVPRADASAHLTTLAREGRTVATVRHSVAATDTLRSLGAGTALAMDNERLQAVLLSRAEDVRASRVRIVGAADAARRRLERDLHDGAQQRLIALSYHLRLARAAALEEGDEPTERSLAEGLVAVEAALDELRDLAHGTYPAVLADSGLVPALETLADTSSVPVNLRLDCPGRCDGAVEAAAYVVVREAVTDATARGAGGVDVTVTRFEESLCVEAEDDGAPRTHELLSVDDRVGALGGRVTVTAHGVRAELPCE